MNHRIANYVVAYEATERGRDAVELGVALARLTGAELRLCLVLPTLTSIPAKVPTGGADFESLLLEQADLWLAEGSSFVPEGVVATTHTFWAESTSEGLIEAATEFLSDRIIVGAWRGGILNRFAIGSVANALLHASPVPIGLAPHGYRAPAAITRITCAVGTRSGWRELLDSTAAMAEGLAVDLRFVTLVEVDAAKARSRLVAETAVSEAHLADVLAYFASVSDTAGTVTTAIASGANIEAATAALDWQRSEIAIVGSSRLASPSRIFIGATANKMLHSLPVPLIVVPTEGLAS